MPTNGSPTTPTAGHTLSIHIDSRPPLTPGMASILARLVRRAADNDDKESNK
jgi:hypothetical protein